MKLLHTCRKRENCSSAKVIAKPGTALMDLTVSLLMESQNLSNISPFSGRKCAEITISTSTASLAPVATLSMILTTVSSQRSLSQW